MAIIQIEKLSLGAYRFAVHLVPGLRRLEVSYAPPVIRIPAAPSKRQAALLEAVLRVGHYVHGIYNGECNEENLTHSAANTVAELVVRNRRLLPRVLPLGRTRIAAPRRLLLNGRHVRVTSLSARDSKVSWGQYVYEGRELQVNPALHQHLRHLPVIFLHELFHALQHEKSGQPAFFSQARRATLFQAQSFLRFARDNPSALAWVVATLAAPALPLAVSQ